MTENVVEPTREELEAKLAELEAKQSALEKVAPELSTRDRSPVKPQDHKPADGALVDVEYGNVTFSVRKGSFTKLVIMDLMEQGMINTAMRKLVGDATYSEFLEKNPEADEETFREMFEKLAEAAGAKN